MKNDLPKQRERVLIMAGGTGGHIFPALAVAQQLTLLGIEVIWIGTKAGLEARLVPEAGYQIEWITVTGLRGKGLINWLLAPWRLIRAFLEALSIIRKISPTVVLGMGGFASGPGGLAAWLLRRPLVIHEQNAIAGLTNRILARLATRVLEAFPDTFNLNAIFTGNPVRAEIAALAKVTRSECHQPWHLLVLGGSQGAAALNTVLPIAIAQLPQPLRPEIWHQSGKQLFESTSASYQTVAINAQIAPFITDMAAAYHWADLVICRAGALTIAEVAAAGVAAVLVPYPHAVDDHQTKNAQLLVDAGAAVLLPQTQFSPERLAEILRNFGEHPEQLNKMGQAAYQVARPNATAEVVARILSARHDIFK